MTPAAPGQGLRAYAVEHLGDEQAVLVLDETGFLKKGEQAGRDAAPALREGAVAVGL